MGRMDWISELPKDLLLRILSLLPAQDVAATMVLSKRWQFLWIFVPRIVFDDSYDQNTDDQPRFSRFVDRFLLLHEGPVIKNLHLKLGQKSGVVDIGVWTRTIVKRCVRELIIEIDSSRTNPQRLPRSFYTVCRILATLKLNNVILVDFSSLVSFSSLKTLSLVSVKYPGDEFVSSLLSNCPVLEDLNVERCPDENLTVFTIRVPSLKRLLLLTSDDSYPYEEYGFVIDAPSLEYLDMFHDTDGFCFVENEIPNIVEAKIEVGYCYVSKILSSITSVKRLVFYLPTYKDVYPVCSVLFHRLEDLKVLTCETEWLDLLMCLLRDSPNLRAIELGQFGYETFLPRQSWVKPSSVPECLLSSLQTIEWFDYEGTEEEQELVKFILRSGSCLKKVSITSKPSNSDKKLEMIKELTLSIRRSPACHLAFY